MKQGLLLTIFIFSQITFSQIGINTTSPDPSSVLDITSTSKGILIPRMTTSQRDLILSPTNSLLIYNSSDNEFQYNSNTPASPVWTSLASGGSSTSNNPSIKYTNSNTSTSQNTNAGANAALIGNLQWNDDSSIYTGNTTNNTITISEAGRYKIIVNIPLITTSNTDNIAPEMRIKINGTAVGSYASTGFLRTSSGHQESSLHLTEILEIAANGVVGVNIARSAASSTVTIREINSASIYIEKLM